MTQFLQRDSQIPCFFAYPKFLITLDLSETTKMIYMLLLDRARLSMQNENWQDDQGRVFIHYTIRSLAETIRMSEMTVKNALKVLEQQGLIYRRRQGAGMPSRIYVKVRTENCTTGETVFDLQTGNCPQIKTRIKTKRNIQGFIPMRRVRAYDTYCRGSDRYHPPGAAL